ncbi:hypothetical protein D3C75_1140460 [compost metagenome]
MQILQDLQQLPGIADHSLSRQGIRKLGHILVQGNPFNVIHHQITVPVTVRREEVGNPRQLRVVQRD